MRSSVSAMQSKLLSSSSSGEHGARTGRSVLRARTGVGCTDKCGTRCPPLLLSSADRYRSFTAMPLKTLTGKHADPRKGRGAGLNPEGRFEDTRREAFDDGWNTSPGDELPPLKTHVTEERVKSIITRNDSPDIPFSQSINPYQGCEHGCVYCMSGDTPILMADGRLRPL